MDTHEPVWAGKAVNYSAKLSQEADRHEILVTERVFGHFEHNDYVRFSCGCGSVAGYPVQLWTTSYSSKLPSTENTVHLLKSAWCDVHGNDFCDAIRNGETDRKLPTWVV